MNFKTWLAPACTLLSVFASLSNPARAQCDYVAVPYNDYISGLTVAGAGVLQQPIDEVKSSAPPIGYQDYSNRVAAVSVAAGSSLPVVARVVVRHWMPEPLQTQLNAWIQPSAGGSWTQVLSTSISAISQAELPASQVATTNDRYTEGEFSLSVPAGVAAGAYRLRFAFDRGQPVDACTGDQGEGEDYALTVVSDNPNPDPDPDPNPDPDPTPDPNPGGDVTYLPPTSALEPFNDYVLGVQLEQIDNYPQPPEERKSADQPLFGYRIYGQPQATLERGKSYQLTVYPFKAHFDPNNPASTNLGVWLDYNGNGSFEASEAAFLGAVDIPAFIPNELQSDTSVITLNVPESGFTGDVRMRVVVNGVGTPNPTRGGIAGEMEDYGITLRPAVDSPDPDPNPDPGSDPTAPNDDSSPYYVAVDPLPGAWFHQVLDEEDLPIIFEHRYTTEGVANAVAPYKITDLGTGRVVKSGSLQLRRGVNRHVIELGAEIGYEFYLLELNGVDLDERRYLRFRGWSLAGIAAQEALPNAAEGQAPPDSTGTP